jgi:membrane protease YdiL (CAAX protease family)
VRAIRAIALTLFLFVLVYAPASALTATLHLQLATAVPFVIITTFLVAGALMSIMARRAPGGPAQFGVCLPAPRYIGRTIVISTPLAIIAALLLSRAHEPGPLAGISLAPWQAILYFVVGAAIQEEMIFRGLLQTTLAGGAAPRTALKPAYGIAASVAVAVLFGAIHLVVGRYTAVAAFVLGVMAGELRRRSGSLVPAIICHASFNLAGFIWP